MSSILVATDQIDSRPNAHYPMRVALPPAFGPHPVVKRHKKTKSYKKKGRKHK